MRQGELKKKYDPVTGKYTRKHVYGEGISDKVRSFGSKVSGKKTPKKQVNLTPPPPQKPSKKAGDEIVKMLSKTKSPTPLKKKVTFTTPKKTGKPQMTQQDINNRLLQIMSGGKIAPRGRKTIPREVSL